MKKKTEQEQSEKIIMITVTTRSDGGQVIKSDHAGFNTNEMLGIMEKVKFSIISSSLK